MRNKQFSLMNKIKQSTLTGSFLKSPTQLDTPLLWTIDIIHTNILVSLINL